MSHFIDWFTPVSRLAILKFYSVDILVQVSERTRTIKKEPLVRKSNPNNRTDELYKLD